MKKYIFCLMFMMMLSICTNIQKVGAYSVTVEEDSMYAEVIPSHIMKNVASMFKKQVKKTMKYYNKYKDADIYTCAKKIPDQYRDFIEIVKKIQDEDKIVIRYPFYIYSVLGEEFCYEYYFVAERNHEKLCIFSIYVDGETGKTTFSYDKMLDCYSSIGKNITDETLFYQIGYVIYAETPAQVSVVKDTTVSGQSMEGDEDYIKNEKRQIKETKAFYQKKYEEKKDVVFEYLDNVKRGKVAKKSNENVKLDLKEEYRTPDKTTETEEHGTGTYIAVCIGVFCILCMVAAGVFIRRYWK